MQDLLMAVAGQPSSGLVLSVMYCGAPKPAEGAPIMAAYVTLPGGLSPSVLEMLVSA